MLNAFSAGYCQSMNYIAGLLLPFGLHSAVSAWEGSIVTDSPIVPPPTHRDVFIMLCIYIYTQISTHYHYGRGTKRPSQLWLWRTNSIQEYIRTLLASGFVRNAHSRHPFTQISETGSSVPSFVGLQKSMISLGRPLL